MSGSDEMTGGRPAWSGTISGMETTQGDDATMLAGRYRVVKSLGNGGMGSVWLAEDTKLENRPVAIKMLPSVLAGKKGAYRQVKEEALMAMKLSHPNIATVRSFDEDEGGVPFLVMDSIEGEPLDDILAEKGPLGEAETLKLLEPVAAALDYAHSQGVVHRDVKPGNVLVDKNGTPFVVDFGIAREIHDTMGRVTGKFDGGTLPYMSPEQLNGAAPQAAQDVYSFAAMAYECLTGAPPFSRGQIEWQIVNNPPPPLPEDVAGAALRAGVMAGLAKKPEERPGTCAEVLRGGGAGGGASRPGEPEKGETDRTAADRTARRDGSPHQGRLPLPDGFSHHPGKRAGVPLGAWEMAVRWCPAGSFTMGSPAGEEGRCRDEQQHRVTLSRGFWMAETEVTQGQWRALMGTTVVDLARKGLLDGTRYDLNDGKGAITTCERMGAGRDTNPAKLCGSPDDDVPIYNVNWNDAVEFCRRLTERERAAGRLPAGLVYRLPTEAEWEYACRAGTTTALPNGQDIRILGANNAPALDGIAWYGGNSSVGFSGRGTDTAGWPEKQYPGGRAWVRKAGLKAPNAWGLLDMIGNVYEWCLDEYGAYPMGAVTDDVRRNDGTAPGIRRVVRGGTWYSDARGCRSAYRRWRPAGFRLGRVGFRPVCGVEVGA